MILVISKTRMHAASFAEALYIMGILAFPSTPDKALSEIDLSYNAVIIIEPDALADPKDYISRIHSYHKTIPVFAISTSGKEYPGVRETYEKRQRAWEIANAILNYQEMRCLPLIGDYALSGISAEAYENTVKYFDNDVGLTKTESMIIRYLIKSYPTPKTARDILAHAFRPSRRPAEASVRTFISLLNAKFRKLAKGNAVKHEDDGYVLRVPIQFD